MITLINIVNGVNAIVMMLMSSIVIVISRIILILMIYNISRSNLGDDVHNLSKPYQFNTHTKEFNQSNYGGNCIYLYIQMCLQ